MPDAGLSGLPRAVFASLRTFGRSTFPPVSRPVSSSTVVAALMTSIVLWGGNNVFIKLLLQYWPPLFTGATRFLIGGTLLAGLIRIIPAFRPDRGPTAAQRRELWLRGAIVLSLYNVACNVCLLYIPASHFALHLAASPVWALLWEEGLRLRRHALPRYLAAGLTLAGVFVLLWPALTGSGHWFGELVALVAGVLWTAYNRECRRLSQGLSGLQVTSGTVWRAGLILLVPAAIEVAWRAPFALTPTTLGLQAYSIVAGSIGAYACWNWALSHWPVSRVALWGNFIPLTTMAGGVLLLGEKPSPSFAVALGLILGGVVLGQIRFGPPPAIAPEA
jgi:drug/metabolite transporter (DMT)-like permease